MKKILITAILSVFIIMSAGSSAQALVNGDFENGEEGWELIHKCTTGGVPGIGIVPERDNDTNTLAQFFIKDYYDGDSTCPSAPDNIILRQENIIIPNNNYLYLRYRIWKSNVAVMANARLDIYLSGELLQSITSPADLANTLWIDAVIPITPELADGVSTRTLTFNLKLIEPRQKDASQVNFWIDDIYFKTPCDVVAKFSADKTTLSIGDTVNFTNESSDNTPDKNAAWAWDFDGDGVTDYADKDNASYQYNEAGTFIAKLTATNPADGCFTTFTQEITVNCDIKAALPEPVTVKVAQEYPFENLSTGTAVDNPATIWAWDVKNSNNASVFTSNLKEPAYSFPSTGTYTINLTASSATGSGCLTTATQTVNVECNVDAAFTLPKTQVKVGEAFTVTNKSTGPAVDNNIAGWSWNFQENGQYGNGTSSTSKNPTFTYLISDTPKNIEIQLTATGTGGCTKLPATQSIEIICDAQANFSSNIPSNQKIFSGQTINFTASGYDNYEWDFGDGTKNTTSLIPSHTYTNNTWQVINRTLKLTTYGTAGCNTEFPPAQLQTVGIIPALGNVNGDDYLDLKDAVTALQVTAGFEDLPDINKEYGDVNNDGKIGLEEAVYVLQKVSELN